MKYKHQHTRQFSTRMVNASVRIFDTAVRISLPQGQKRLADKIGDELASQLVCEDYRVQDETDTELWLEPVDVLYLQATGTDFENLVREIGLMNGYDIRFEPSG